MYHAWNCQELVLSQSLHPPMMHSDYWDLALQALCSSDSSLEKEPSKPSLIAVEPSLSRWVISAIHPRTQLENTAYLTQAFTENGRCKSQEIQLFWPFFASQQNSGYIFKSDGMIWIPSRTELAFDVRVKVLQYHVCYGDTLSQNFLPNQDSSLCVMHFQETTNIHVADSSLYLKEADHLSPSWSGAVYLSGHPCDFVKTVHQFDLKCGKLAPCFVPMPRISDGISVMCCSQGVTLKVTSISPFRVKHGLEDVLFDRQDWWD